VVEPLSDDALERAYLDDERTAPWLCANMVTTIDGATAIDGRSSSIGDDQDLVVFRALRAASDLIVVAAATARAEGYGRVRLPDHLVDWRRSLGRSEVPRIALVSTSLEFDLEPFGDDPPIVITSDASNRPRRSELSAVTDVLVCGEERVEMSSAVSSLRDEGYGRILSEGGPTLNGQLAAGDLVDEWCVTVAPIIVAGDSQRIVAGTQIEPDRRRFRLDRALVGTTSLFTRWVRAD
jgi:5-amino-6-(5-phosphoribosylamino)uracil reductase